jgi:hypothetical protein
LVAACAVFPDEATLPTAAAGGGGGGGGGDDRPLAGAGEAGVSVAGRPDAGATQGFGGAADGGTPSDPPGSAGAEPTTGGAGGAPSHCDDPHEVVVPAVLDTWIEAARPKQSHINDSDLFVAGEPDERRALLQLTLPAATDSEVLIRARLTLHLKANADSSGSARELGLHRLTHEVGSSTTWDNYGNGASRKWAAPGGDFGPELARIGVSSASSEGLLTFDVTGPIRTTQSSTALTLSVVILEIGAAPPASSALALDAVEGDASMIPRLLLTYCAP